MGQFAIRSAYLLGAERVIAIDHVPERLRMAEQGKAEVLDFEGADVVEELKWRTGGRGPDACIDCVGLEADGSFMQTLLGAKMKIQAGAATAIHWAIHSVRKAGAVSIVISSWSLSSMADSLRSHRSSQNPSTGRKSARLSLDTPISSCCAPPAGALAALHALNGQAVRRSHVRLAITPIW